MNFIQYIQNNHSEITAKLYRPKVFCDNVKAEVYEEWKHITVAFEVGDIDVAFFLSRRCVENSDATAWSVNVQITIPGQLSKFLEFHSAIWISQRASYMDRSRSFMDFTDQCDEELGEHSQYVKACADPIFMEIRIFKM